ncbi:hypothetical protein MKX50_16320 [Paenibacillus sp. FSL W8-0186]|uniref:Uncharacterized protein n=1 Tax=Paenibacillus woosongensis TaxID=307580 RepID=A0ABQ4MPD0_9BACL|nr:hypothetical protein [Paenibacillus woosongensis]GIP57859.1 hypothetical protein J15TS10_16730 [Paenibacillus woosongensis]
MSKQMTVLQSEIEDLAKIKITDEMLSKVDISSLIPKITEVVGHLDDAQDSLDKLSEQGMFKMWWGSFTGGNDKVLANAEKTLIESSKMNIGLAMLTTMYAKVIKDQQNVLHQQQRELKEQNDAIREQQEHIEQLWGISHDQAKQILAVIRDQQTMIDEAEQRLILQFRQEQELGNEKLQQEMKEQRGVLEIWRKELQEQLRQEIADEQQMQAKTAEKLIFRKMLWWVGGALLVSLSASYLINTINP